MCSQPSPLWADVVRDIVTPHTDGLPKGIDAISSMRQGNSAETRVQQIRPKQCMRKA
ncbi:MAG: hypothetical protein M9928_20160 [Anaerolineae bacterium]|nr:hypothetical protein [Anaerolineae bacterium]MCO5190762.1 hypothetical protein [Anaerolineae bacterium]MCO5192486.1 hypothetical protein [Anaerolineae bacterium]MCO5207329.1 hypothetical protein [Anaerolineae bacterium]